MLNSISIIIVYNSRKCIVSNILNIISQNKIDWLSVEGLSRGLFLCLPTDWYHTSIRIISDIGMAEEILGK